MILGRTLVLVVGGAVAVASAVVGCSSVPDVVFSDDGGVTTPRNDGGSTSSDANGPPPQYSCPDKPPPAGTGICCGNEVCLGCESKHCASCALTGCGASEACCAKNPGRVDCRPQAQCL